MIDILADSFIAFDGNKFSNMQFSFTDFHYGFVLYAIVTPECSTADDFEALCVKTNVNEILQIEFSFEKLPMDDEFREIGCCSDSESKTCQYKMQEASMELMQNVNVRNRKEAYVEWGRIISESMYSSGKAYEIWIKWFMATGKTVADVVLKNWARGANRLGFHLFAIPEDIFAEPSNPVSSPLRCPIFIKANIEDIPKEHLAMIIRKSLKVFGFIPINCFQHWKAKSYGELQYVHMCGGMFVKFIKIDGKGQFLWSWNHMFSQLYRTPVCTESFLDMMLKDFCDFWNNENNRLDIFVFQCLSRTSHVDRTEITSSLFPEVLLFDKTWNAVEDLRESDQNSALYKYFTPLNEIFF